MRINPISPQSMVNTYSVARRPESSAPQKIASRDRLELSDFAVMYSGAIKAVKAELSVPTDEKVERIAKAIREGTYNVDARDVAERIFSGSRLG